MKPSRVGNSLREKEIEKMILDYLSMDSSFYVWKQNVTGIWDEKMKTFRSLKGYAKTGVSDILGIIKPWGVFLAIEVKTPSAAKTNLKKYGHMATPNQHAFLKEIAARGGVAGVATCLEHAIEIKKKCVDRNMRFDEIKKIADEKRERNKRDC